MPRRVTSASSGSPLARIGAVALRKGVRGGSSGWLLVGLVVSVPRVVRRLTRSDAPQVVRTRIAPGETIVVSAPERPRRRHR